ncbi:c-type cytochrome [Ramlibacter sp. RBP-2]|uniref:C-type cytochrome n=1 Tax=Ramlibacter lithotrophicus TaxID=2606681 RepID=A0A7X6DCS9_9BURK|nr:cytochrome c/FTR1 family iron permease [Ramlibacter lithotrophicus]NKE64820.1 c-type cytochrome [Ramlibacter lithotrophicus]
MSTLSHRRPAVCLPWLRWLAAGLAFAAVAVAASPVEQAQTVVHLLDYVAVDYPEFVQDGKVVDEAEYREQREFAGRAIELLQQLPAPGQAAVVGQARTLLQRIEAKAPGAEVAALANGVRSDVIRVYGLVVAPRQAPDLQRAASLFAAQCAACHGAQGHGDGPAAKGMEPAPSDFHDQARMNVRSIYGLYNTITLGVGGTPMRAFAELSDADRWALAFFVSAMRAQPQVLGRGEALWGQGVGKPELGSLRAMVTAAPGEVAGKSADLDAVRAWLTANPQVLQSAGPAPLELTRSKLDETVAAWRRGDAAGARQAAITAYLEGFELVEASLDNVDGPLRTDIEREMMALRTLLDQGRPVDAVAEHVQRLKAMLDRAQEKLGAGSLSPSGAFASALLILLREGLEAILVLAAIVAFVIKTGRRDALPYIHAGWIAAMALGGATWLVATHVVQISGANRELTEGVAALLAAAMLLYVGYWLHGKSNAQAWQAFIQHQVTAALGKRTLWAMAGVSFLAVYRELFEIILFYQALWAQVGTDGRGAFTGGIAVAAVLLAVLGWAILKYSVRLPVGPFFVVMSALLVAMAFVFVGHGVAALQEAGVVKATAVGFVELPLLGIHATAQGLAWQALTLALIVAALLWQRQQARAPQAPRAG